MLSWLGKIHTGIHRVLITREEFHEAHRRARANFASLLASSPKPDLLRGGRGLHSTSRRTIALADLHNVLGIAPATYIVWSRLLP